MARNGEKEPVYGDVELKWCPGCERDTEHKWIKYRHIYSHWECSVCGLVIMGEPYRRVKKGTDL